MKVVLFCGGRGSASIIRAFVQRPHIELTLLVNGYDDGQSTGALRRFLPGMLGPSDFRKNLSWLLPPGAPLASLMEYRFSPAAGAHDIEQFARFVRSNDTSLLEPPLKDWFAQVPDVSSARLREMLRHFFDRARGSAFDYRDCCLGNLVFAGAYLIHRNDFNAAIADVSGLAGGRARLLNVAEGQNRILVALKQDGTFLAGEAAIVALQSPAPITGLYLMRQSLTPTEQQELATLDFTAKQRFLTGRDAVPPLSADAAAALAQTDMIVYGPGTQHSSLLPSYRIAAAALASAPARVKALIVNLDSDHDIQGLSAADIADRAVAHGAAVTDILVDETPRLRFLPGDRHGNAQVRHGAFADVQRPGLHDGDAVVRHLMGEA